jgi:DNA replication protein DnaC
MRRARARVRYWWSFPTCAGTGGKRVWRQVLKSETSDVNRPVCALCEGTGWRPVEENGVRRVGRCGCWRDGVSRQRVDEARIPKRYLHCTLENFVAYNPSLARAVDLARRIVETFPQARKGLFLEGQPGVGKTHLAVAALKEVVQRAGARGLFYDTRDLLRVIRSTYDPSIRTTEIEILRPVMDAELLVLDDLGAEKTSEWVDETMNLIVNTRYNERRLTIFTSNYPDIPDDTDSNALVFRIGHRMRSRLHEMCDFEVMDGADYRELPTNGGVDDLVAMSRMRRKTLPSPRGGRQARAQLREPHGREGTGDLKWPGGRAGS